MQVMIRGGLDTRRGYDMKAGCLLKEAVLFLWQLPQNTLGALVVLFTGAEKVFTFATGQREWFYATDKGAFGVSLGHFIVFGTKGDVYPRKSDLEHEMGHQVQSRILGPLYLIVVGLPSLLGNRWDVAAHKKWSTARRVQWYFAWPWEAWADRLGGVDRNGRI